MHLLFAIGARLDGFSPDSNSYQLPRGLARLASRLELLLPEPDRLAAELRPLACPGRGVPGLLRRFAGPAPDAVLTGVDSWSLLVGMTLGVARRVPWLMVCWDHPFGARYAGRPGVARRAERRARLTALRRAVAASDGLVLLINPGLLESLGLAPRRVIALTNGVAVDVIDAALEGPRPPVPGPELRVGVLGAVAVDKGALLALDAFALVAERHPAARLRFVGEVVDRDRRLIEERVRALRLSDRVEFTGAVPFAQAMRLIGDCAVGLHAYAAAPWLRWNHVLKVGEYQALGVPVVAADRPGVRDLVTHGQTGLIAEGDAPAAYAAAISALLTDPARRADLARAGRRAAEGRAWPVVHERLFSHLRRLVGGRG